jgi:hypothetical protein
VRQSPFVISKWEVWEAYKRVKANKGAAGVDDQSIEDFERNLKGNLYKIWNRMRLRTPLWACKQVPSRRAVTFHRRCAR